MQNGDNAKAFLKGSVPERLPDGFYKGKVNVKTGWQGKKFNAKEGIGINIVDEKENYPFKLYKGRGIQDNIDVVKIDYSKSNDPFWLRFILDEVVEIKPNHYLGKVHLTFIPRVPFTIGYFELEK